ncbi:MAG TPA: hypothetical protein VMQ86_03195 [Bryobacteraceae bacterium]|nr:hypothetical protein [Bryobacteraceae bacterium]
MPNGQAVKGCLLACWPRNRLRLDALLTMAQKARGDTADILLNLNWQRTLCARAGFAPPQRRDPPEVGAFPFRTSPKPIRIVWIVFDELSQEIAFANRPADLRLPISTVCGRRASTPPQPSLLSPPAVASKRVGSPVSPRLSLGSSL